MDRRSFLKGAGSALLLSSPFLFPNHSSALGSGLIEGSESTYFAPREEGVKSFDQPNDFLYPKDWRSHFLSGQREVSLFRSGTAEKGRFVYLNSDGSFNREGYLAACSLLRDVKAGQAAYMSPDLLDTMCIMQRWLRHYGHEGNIYVNSGYRTARTNNSLEGASRNSYHLRGMAVDMIIPGVSTRTLSNMALMMEKGGVGFYSAKGFVHVDTGRIRFWRG